MSTRWISYARVLSVTEVVEHRDYHRNRDTGEVTSATMSTGVWAVRLDGSSAVHLPERPDLEVGDRVRLTMERADG